ncbi:YjcZ family sporulation protein [Bacillus campisalis]
MGSSLHRIWRREKRRYMFMGQYNAGFALIVVLFILLIIVGSAFC